MKFYGVTSIIVGLANARSVADMNLHHSLSVPAAAETKKAKVASLIEPPLKDVASDKKFFGPPFPADYPQDSRPEIQKHVLNKLKSPDQPYPALQSKHDFDKDFVKDENSDRGTWKAQFEYDNLRKKLAGEERDVKAAEDAANKEGKDVDGAQQKADEAGKNADAAKKDADATNNEKVGSQGTDDAADVDPLPPSKENLEKLKKQVAEAEANYAKEQKEFEQCKKNLEEAEQAVKDLKAKVQDMEAQLAGETKLWAESKAVRLNLHKAKVDASHAKTIAAEARLKVALNTKADTDKALATQKAEADKARANLDKQNAQLADSKKQLDAAAERLRKLRGYKPAVEAAPVKSASAMQSAIAFVGLAVLQCFW